MPETGRTLPKSLSPMAREDSTRLSSIISRHFFANRAETDAHTSQIMKKMPACRRISPQIFSAGHRAALPLLLLSACLFFTPHASADTDDDEAATKAKPPKQEHLQ